MEGAGHGREGIEVTAVAGVEPAKFNSTYFSQPFRSMFVPGLVVPSFPQLDSGLLFAGDSMIGV